MKNSKKVLAFVLAAAMLFSLAACSGGGSSAKTTAKAGNTPDNPYEEKIAFSYLTNYCAGLPDSFMLKDEIEEKFNVDITIPNFDTNADFATFQLHVTAGEMPDFLAMGSSLPLVLDWYDQEVIRSIPLETIRKNAPNYTAVMDADPSGWKIYSINGDDKNIMAMSGYMPAQQNSVFWADYYRLDWLEKLGIKPNGEVKQLDENYDYMYYTDEGFTLDQMMEIFKAYKDGDPDGNGVDDTTAFVGYVNWYMHGWQSIAGAFGLSGISNVEENGKTINYYSSERWKEFLKFANGVYEDGLVDKEWFTNDWTRTCEKHGTGKYGYISTSSGYFSDETTRAGKTGLWARGPLNGIADVPTGKLLLSPPVIGSEGQQNSALYGVSPFRYQFVFSESCDDAKMERILQMLDYTAFSEEGFTRYAYGVEGTHYTMKDDGFGNMVKTPDPELGKPGAPGGGFVFSTAMFLPLDHRQDINILPLNKKINEITYSDKWMEFATGPKRMDLLNETKLGEYEAENGANIETLVKEFMAGVISGTVDIDAEWGNYLGNLDKAGYQDILTELNKAPLYEDLFPGKKSVK